MLRRTFLASAISALSLAACAGEATLTTPASIERPAAAARTAEEVATELSTRVSTIFGPAWQGLDDAETPEQAAEAGAEMLALGDEINAATYPGVTVTMAHPRLPWFVEVSGDDGVFCVGDLSAMEEITTDEFVLYATEGPCQDVPPREELDAVVAVFSGDPDAFLSVVENSRTESARLSAEAAIRNVQALVALERGMDPAVDDSVERIWASTAIDFAGTATILDATGAVVEESDDRHDRYVIVSTVGAGECTATVDIVAAYVDYAEATVSSVVCD